MDLSRRAFVSSALRASGTVLLASQLGRSSTRAAGAHAPAALPDPETSGIDHVVVVMMENRSFDHFLGWLPNADGRQDGLSYRDPQGGAHPTYHQTQLNGCGFSDPDHSYDGGRTQYNGGKMDGFLADAANDSYAVSYYRAADRPFMSSLALAYTTCDRYFCSILGPTYPNRFYQHAAQTDRLDNTMALSSLPTIWDQLNRPGGPSGRYYFSDVPFLALWGAKYLGISAPYAQFLADAATGALPNVSFVDPRFEDEGSGTSGDDHPLADIRAGDAFLSEIFHALASGPAWGRTVLVVNYDEWGGFYEHVAPPRVTAAVPIGASPASGPDKDLDAQGRALLGFRVPCIVASPFSRGSAARPRVAHARFDHTSVLKMIEWRWGLAPLTQRDASPLAGDPGNLATVLDLATPRPEVPALPVLGPFVSAGCPATLPGRGTPSVGLPGGAPVAPGGDRDTWTQLAAAARAAGWA
ncbi:MAG TPA: alkaline phosphatase family protein [Acidimicrobiales bacterium]|nr:alkaline phosphatase family protein [Acidimicrobiales bacterium]